MCTNTAFLTGKFLTFKRGNDCSSGHCRCVLRKFRHHKLKPNSTVPCMQCTESQSAQKFPSIIIAQKIQDPHKDNIFRAACMRTATRVQVRSWCADYTNLSPAEASSTKPLPRPGGREKRERTSAPVGSSWREK